MTLPSPTMHVKTALFLGAGASAFANQPTTRELMDLVRQRANNTAWSGQNSGGLVNFIVEHKIYTDVEKLYDGIDRMHRLRDIPNFLPIFLALHGSDTTFKNTLDDMAHLRSIIRDVLLDSFDIDLGSHETIKHMFDMVRLIMGAGETGGLRVFTTNYDTVMEAYADAGRLEIVNGFKHSGHLTRIWADEWARHTDRPPLYLTKLHGSVRWYKDGEGNIMESGDVKQRNMERDVMIYPTEGAKDYGREPFATMLRRFKKDMKDIDVLLVIGFSYRDEDIADIIINEVENGMALISVSPDAASDIRRVSHAYIETMEPRDYLLKTIGKRIVLINKKFQPDNADSMIKFLKTAYRFVRPHVRSAQGGNGKDAAP